MDYCSSVWGVKRHQSLDNVQHRAMRYFLGVHRFTPILTMVGDTGWLPSIYRRWRSMIRLWNRLILMNDERLTKKVFNADLELHNSSKNWSFEIKQVMNDIGLSDQFESKSVINLSKVDEHLNVFYTRKWQEDVQHVPKLRTYRVFKSEFKTEEYVKLNMYKNGRSIM